MDDNNLIPIPGGSTEIWKPSIFIVHLAFIAAQLSFGGSAVVGSLGLPSTNPVLFAMIREGIAGPILCIGSFILTRKTPKITDFKLFIIPGLFLFLNQLFYIIGLKLSDSISAAAFQPSQPILAVLYGYCLRIEKNIDRYKISGILIACIGALIMILFGEHDATDNKSVWNMFGGYICFFINCSGTVFYLITNKKALKKYDSFTVTAYSYIVASIGMVICQFIVASSPKLLNNLCDNKCNGPWDVPTSTIYALVYWILFTSIFSYLLITWANKHSDPSVNLAYSVLQPATAAFVSGILIGFKIVPKCLSNPPPNEPNADNCLYDVDLADLGAIGIAIGLFLVIYSDKKQRKQEMFNNNQYDNNMEGINHDNSDSLIKTNTNPSISNNQSINKNTEYI